jgi:hypothetical protein
MPNKPQIDSPDESDFISRAIREGRICAHEKMVSGQFDNADYCECSECGFHWYAPLDGDLENALKVWDGMMEEEAKR